MANKHSFLIEIPRRSRVCSSGQEPLFSGKEYYSVLIENEEGYSRQDYCFECWENKAKSESQDRVYTYWKSKIPEKELDPKNEGSRDEKALSLLKESITLDSDKDHVHAFVLALYLVRKKQIALRKELKKNSEQFNLYEDLTTGEMLCVKKIDLSHFEIKKVQLEMAEKLRR